MVLFLLIVAFLILWCGSVLALLISSWREEKRLEEQDKKWR